VGLEKGLAGRRVGVIGGKRATGARCEQHGACRNMTKRESSFHCHTLRRPQGSGRLSI
jgi:hypothetical protein